MLKYDIAEKAFYCNYCGKRIRPSETFVEGNFVEGNHEKRCYPGCQIGDIIINNMKKPEGTAVIKDGSIVIQK